VTDMSQFDLSRVYAKGWSAGRASELDPADPGLEAAIDALNPHGPTEERSRWSTGFKDALSRNEELSGSRKRPGGFKKPGP